MFLQLGRWPLMDPDEGRNASVAREMLATGSWGVPQFNGLPFLDKPPALFWSVCGAFSLFGPSEAAARLPSAIAGALLSLVTLALGRRLLDDRSALWAGIVVATSPIVLVFARLTIFDMPLTLFVTAALYCLVRRRLGGAAALWWSAAAFCMGVAFLTKGPVGVALPFVAWIAGRGALPAATKRGGAVALACAGGAFFAVVLPWVVMVARLHPDFLSYAVVDETLLRFTSEARFRRGGPWFYPLAAAFVGMGAWGAVLLAASRIARTREGAPARERAAIAFAVRCAGAILVFFIASASKRPGYVLPAIVPLSLVAGATISLMTSRVIVAVRRAALIALASVALGVSYASLHEKGMGVAAEMIYRAVTPEVVAVVFATCAVWSSLVILASTVSSSATLGLVAAFAPALYMMLLGPLAPFAESRSARALARLAPPGATVVSFRHFRPSFPFYLGRPVLLATVDGHELTSNYVASRSARFLETGGLVSPPRAREIIRTAQSVVVLTAASWVAAVPAFRRPPLILAGTDARSALWVSHG